eukprot:CAMPEP_0171499150 /NCGR_PEP_ID=MMETSP0958-20121227/8274_1 /TAXON_ID=87120 /ORGANISM="Aurantiochytrium limacinum, Strain ATCCMYA-1381" /LENGTH=289 /DNA_ID=CAMNT_0012033685 /DNA_START=637 /DNA_END=1506 /DNA_ORIENTATION=-
MEDVVPIVAPDTTLVPPPPVPASVTSCDTQMEDVEVASSTAVADPDEAPQEAIEAAETAEAIEHAEVDAADVEVPEASIVESNDGATLQEATKASASLAEDPQDQKPAKILTMEDSPAETLQNLSLYAEQASPKGSPGSTKHFSEKALRMLGMFDEADGSSPKSGSGKGMSEKAMRMLGIENEEQVLRVKALNRLGLTEEDLYMSSPHFCKPEDKERLLRAYEKKGLTEKLPKITGMSEEQILRRKAVGMLGATENEIDNDRELKLASLGATAASVYNKEKQANVSCFR